jgi:hypothetical protein
VKIHSKNPLELIPVALFTFLIHVTNDEADPPHMTSQFSLYILTYAMYTHLTLSEEDTFLASITGR